MALEAEVCLHLVPAALARLLERPTRGRKVDAVLQGLEVLLPEVAV